MNRPVHLLRATLLVLAFLVSCKRGEGAAPVVPKGFDVSLLKILACPEDLSKLRLATGTELEAIRAGVSSARVRFRDGRVATEPFDGLLIRADGRVAYMVKGGVADMLIEDGLVLDQTVGPADPARYRR